MDCGRISKLQAIEFDFGTPDKPMPCVTATYVSGSGGLPGSWLPEGPEFICQFNTSQIAVCYECVLKAFKKAVAELV